MNGDLRFDNLRVRHHQFLVKAPPDYFIAKFNYLVSKSNSFRGYIRNGAFKGFVGPDLFPWAYFVSLFFTLDFSVEEKDGNTQLNVTTALNPTFVWIWLITLLTLIIGALYAAFAFKNTALDAVEFFVLAPALLGFYLWLILRDSRNKCLNQFQMILKRIELAWSNR